MHLDHSTPDLDLDQRTNGKPRDQVDNVPISEARRRSVDADDRARIAGAMAYLHSSLGHPVRHG